MADYVLETDLIALQIFKLLPHKLPFRLAMDRTNWKFGGTNINILTLAIMYQDVASPILYSMLPKFGNTNMAERIELKNRYIRIFGADTIDLSPSRPRICRRTLANLSECEQTQPLWIFNP